MLQLVHKKTSMHTNCSARAVGYSYCGITQVTGKSMAHNKKIYVISEVARQRGTAYRAVLCLTVIVGMLMATSSVVHAAAAAQRRGQMQQQQQQMMQEQYQQQIMQQQYQQAVAQKQAQEVAQYQQIMAQKQAYEKAMQEKAAYQKAAMEYAAYKQQMQQAVAQRQAQMQQVAQVKAAVEQKQAQQVAQYQQAAAYKQAVEVAQYKQTMQAKQIQAIKQKQAVNQQVNEYSAYLAKRKQIVEQQAAITKQTAIAKDVMQKNVYDKATAMKTAATAQALTQAQVEQNAAEMSRRQAQQVKSRLDQAMPTPGSDPSGETTEVDIRDLWGALDTTSLAWSQILDREIKVLTVAEYIDRFSKTGIKIKKSPGGYAMLIDGITSQNPELLEAPFMNVLSYAAIVDYDFENGENKDELAHRILGEERFQANKQRLSGH